MKKILVIAISFMFLIPTICWSQGKVTRPKKTDPSKKESPKQTERQNQTTSVQQKRTEPAPVYTSSEIINGINVRWDQNITPAQKTAITNLLNNMVYVQGGSFMMGSDDSDAFDDEKPVHRETVSSFRIDKYEVTQKLWQAVMGNNPSYFKGENLPVENVSWNECQDFIQKLNRLTGLSFRLPIEAEWEYAARGGNKSNKYKYSGSNMIGNIGWYGGNSGNKTHQVGTNSPNELGLYDMTGNVWEWTSDKYSSNYNSTRNSSNYVYRGGSWSSYARYTRVSYRSDYGSAYRYRNLGFRLVL